MSTNIHQLVDGHGPPLAVLLTPGQAGDAPMFEPLMADLRIQRPVERARTRPDALRGDKAYSSRAIRIHRGRNVITAAIPEPDHQMGHRKSRGSRGRRPPKFDAHDYRGRNVIERRYYHLTQWRGLATRCDKHAITDRTAIALNAVIAWTRNCQTRPRSGCWSPGRVPAGGALLRG